MLSVLHDILICCVDTCEDNEQWVITEEFRLMDELVVDARCKDSAWMPWQVAWHRISITMYYYYIIY